MSKKNGADFAQWFGPILDALRDLGDSGKPREVADKIAEKLNIPDNIINETLKSGQSRFYNQVAWARQYLVWEGFLDSSKHGTWKLTSLGKKTKINEKDANKIIAKWVSIHRKTKDVKSDKEVITEQEEKSPTEIDIDSTNLLEVLQNLSPSGFERITRELLREHNFENVEVTGGSHDGGIDGYGTLEINPFVSFKVIFQCKRYKGSVSRAQVGDFRNAMIGRAEKGIIITTGTFTKEAVKEANRDGAPHIELVDGLKLIEMFEKVELGVKPKTVYEVDLNYFKPFME